MSFGPVPVRWLTASAWTDAVSRCFWFAVICPYPVIHPEGDDCGSGGGDAGNDISFGRYWSKTNTVPLYLIVLLLPLLSFRSASFFARFTFLGKTDPDPWG